MWHRKIINAYWAIVGMISIAQVILIMPEGLGIMELSKLDIKLNWRAILNGGMLLLMVFMEFWLHYGRKFKKQKIVICGFLLSYSLYFIGPMMYASPFVLLLPVLVSLVYLDWKLVVSYSISCILLYSVIYFFLEYTIYAKPMYEFIYTECVFIVFIMIARTIIIRVNEFKEHLENVIKSEQQLMVEKTISDKLLKIDALTGLYNHKTFHEYLEVLLEQCENNQLSLSLALIDIDNFKQVNDTYGHRVGDLVLEDSANKLTSLMMPNDFAARYGGEEFAVIFTDKTADEAVAMAEGIRQGIEQLVHPYMENKPITVSIGLCVYHQGYGKENLFHNADQALYEAKRSGKNRVVTADECETRAAIIAAERM
ncbi:two-component system cell cycle response regulator [Paenibacillus sp. DS2015]|uniref:GGDEF domain-containing protein n=1 Tax=Paenibacillus sp. DS2015 TaxID=3373917 RepID=UPI003D1EA0CD